MMTRDEILEHDVLKSCYRIGLANSTKTKASGQVRGDGDITSKTFMFECKFRNTDSLSISGKDMRKAISQAAKQLKKAVLVRENSEGMRTATILFSDFEWLIKLILEANNNCGF